MTARPDDGCIRYIGGCSCRAQSKPTGDTDPAYRDALTVGNKVDLLLTTVTSVSDKVGHPDRSFELFKETTDVNRGQQARLPF